MSMRTGTRCRGTVALIPEVFASRKRCPKPPASSSSTKHSGWTPAPSSSSANCGMTTTPAWPSSSSAPRTATRRSRTGPRWTHVSSSGSATNPSPRPKSSPSSPVPPAVVPRPRRRPAVDRRPRLPRQLPPMGQDHLPAQRSQRQPAFPRQHHRTHPAGRIPCRPGLHGPGRRPRLQSRSCARRPQQDRPHPAAHRMRPGPCCRCDSHRQSHGSATGPSCMSYSIYALLMA